MISPVVWDNTLELLSPSEMERIHEATLTVMGKTGVKMPMYPERLEKAQDLGLKYDRASSRAFFPAEVVEKALMSAPSTYTLYARNPENDFVIDGKHGYLTSDGSATRYKDLSTGEIRGSVMRDLEELSVVCDYMPQISFLWPSVSAADKTERIQPLYEFIAMLRNTSKHIQTMTAVDPLNARGTIEIARSLIGGAESLRKKPIISNFLCPFSPLMHDKEMLEAAFIYAEAGVPTGFLNMQIACSTAPATAAGSLVLGNAEILSGIALLELLFPGAPTFYGSCATTMELTQGGLSCGCPEDVQMQVLNSQMAHFYNLPANIGTCATSAKDIDWESGMKNSVSIMMSMLSKADMMCGGGLLNNSSVFSLEQMVLDCENYDFVRRSLQSVPVDEESLAIDVIDKVGPGNHYMLEEHTINHIRDIWQPTVMHKGGYDDWVHKGGKSPARLANEKIKKILAEHQPVIYQDDSDVDAILEQYGRYAAEE